MTTIVGVQREHGCIIVTDSRIVGEGKIYLHPNMAKAVEYNNYIVAAAGDLRGLQITLHAWNPPAITAKDKKNLYEFVINKVAPSLKKKLIDEGIDFTKSSDDDDKFELSVLIAVNGTLFEIDDDFSVTMSQAGLYAIGSGGDYALGALYAGADPVEAVRIASLNNNGTSAPFNVFKQDCK